MSSGVEKGYHSRMRLKNGNHKTQQLNFPLKIYQKVLDQLLTIMTKIAERNSKDAYELGGCLNIDRTPREIVETWLQVRL